MAENQLKVVCAKCGKVISSGDEVIVLKKGVVIDRVLCKDCGKLMVN
jgi:hypothetical protein